MNGLKRYLIFGSLLIIGYLLLQYYKPRPTDWTATYLAEDKIPFGTYILRRQLTDLFPNAKVKIAKGAVYNTLKERQVGKSNFLIIASNLKIDTLDYQQMIKYMRAGNNIFVAAYQIDDELLNPLNLKIGANLNFQDRRTYPINFVNPSLKREQDYYFDRGIGEQYFSKIDTTKAVVLGLKNGDLANFIQYKFGNGALFILPNPQMLTNYSLLKEDGMDYASKALSYLPKASNVIWDERYTRIDEQDQSVLRVIFKYDQLRWAYYIAILTLVVFILFEIKRRQRIIPVINPLKNSTVEFVEVVGRVYYQQRNNKDIAEKKVVYLFEYIRNKYRLKTTEINSEFFERLKNISGATADAIDELFIEISHLNTPRAVDDAQLIRLNKLIETFYQQDR